MTKLQVEKRPKKKRGPLKVGSGLKKLHKNKRKKLHLSKTSKEIEMKRNLEKRQGAALKLLTPNSTKKKKTKEMKEAYLNGQKASKTEVGGIKTDAKRSKRKRTEEFSATQALKKPKVNANREKEENISGKDKEASTTQLTRKQRRNRKKNNSKKNKYKHLALNKVNDGICSESKKTAAVSGVLSDGVDHSNGRLQTVPKQVPLKAPKEKLTHSESALKTVKPRPDEVSLKRKKKKKKTDTGQTKKVGENSEVKHLLNRDKVVGSKKKKKTFHGQKTVNSEPADVAELGTADISESDEDSVWSCSADEDFSDSGESDVENGSGSSGGLNKIQSQKKTPPADTVPQPAKQQKSKPATFADQARQKLNAARFRYLNEQLYTSTGKQALEMFHDDPEAYKVYHEGFQAQVARWPVNPLDTIIKQLSKGNAGCVVADFGCGDGRLAESLPGRKVHSFDLVASKPFITACNIARVPLEKSSVDVAVFCLSLMGTNLSDYLCEANRVLKQGGTLKIAEVVSRFYSVNNFVRNVEALGFHLQKKVFLGKMFLLFKFKKTGETSRKKAPRIQLKACHYKRR